jgi:hypothetical protein
MGKPPMVRGIGDAGSCNGTGRRWLLRPDDFDTELRKMKFHSRLDIGARLYASGCMGNKFATHGP